VTQTDRNALHFAWMDSPVGLLLMGATETTLRLLEFVNHDRYRGGCTPTGTGSHTQSSVSSPILDQARRELEEYFAGVRRSFDVPLSFSGTPFQERVWSVLRGISYGERLSYLEESRRVGDEKAIRAVAQANGQNPIAIIIPCHRVINADGKLGGFGGGLLRKQFLLDLERGDRLL
jgi:methylated-DNA-[protein]-cysteine S-methyltransferase